MSLRLRVLVALVLVLLASSAMGAGLAGWQARQTLREELAAALNGGRQTVLRAYEDLPRSDHAPDDLAMLVATFDGDRHLRARLVGVGGATVARSHPAAAAGAPAWFQRVIAPPVDEASLPPPIPGYAGLILETDSRADVSSLWVQFQGLMLGLAAVLVAGALLAWIMVGRALRPVADLSAAVERIGSGDYGAHLRTEGPTEIARLSRGVNEMAQRLAAIDARNRALEQQLLTLQDEERADLARDLHDEIGPHLFAVSVDAAMAGRLIAENRAADAQDQLRAIQTAVAHVQRLVRDILARLRPTQLVELGLSAAIDDLVGFWRARRPEITFDVRLAEVEDEIGEAAREALYRMVQEGLSNAVRHGGPQRVEVVVRVEGGRVFAEVSDDGASASAPGVGGFGLIGMRERVEQAGGTLSIEAGGPGRPGWKIVATLPSAQEGLGSPCAS